MLNIFLICFTTEIPNTKLGYILGITSSTKRNFVEATTKIEITKRVIPSYTLAPLGISLMIGVNIISL